MSTFDNGLLDAQFYQTCAGSLLSLEQVWKLLSEVVDLRQIVVHDVRLIGMLGEIILMVVLGFVESFQRNHLCHNRTSEDFRSIELIDVGIGDTLLLVVRIED